MVNLDVYDAALAKIDADPASWDQTQWIGTCGTVACLFGHIALAIDPDVNMWDVKKIATEALGITVEVAEKVAAAGNTRDALTVWRQLLAGERVRMPGADLYRADLSGADLSGADLYRADLSRADLSRANLSGADLSGANLSDADLSGADLSGADLSHADLSSADLSDADLSDADLSRADLSDADLRGAHLRGVDTGVSGE